MTIENARFFILFLFYFGLIWASTEKSESDLLVFSVATEKTDGYERFIQSIENYGHNVTILGMGEKWRGGDVRYYPGGGQKVKLLKKALEPHKESTTTIILFTDSYDVVFAASPKEILKRFRTYFGDAKIVFSAEGYCWPDKGLAVKYPIVKSGKRYLNSGGFMGFAKDVYDMLSENSFVEDNDDDQLYYTKTFLDEDLRERYAIRLDGMSEIFQNLNGAIEDVVLDFPQKSTKDAQIRNIAYGTSAAVVHGNGGSKGFLNWLGNYLGKYWSLKENCAGCNKNRKSLTDVKEKDLPLITAALFIEKPTPFLEFFFDRIQKLKYPKSRIDLFIHNRESRHDQIVEEFLETHGTEYRSVKVLLKSETEDERDGRNKAIDHCQSKSCDYFFFVDSEAQLTNENTLLNLIEANRPLIAPMLTRPGKLWTNFWGSLSDEGFYARSEDYIELVQYTRKGIWNVPYISSAYLVETDRLKNLENPFSYDKKLDSDMSFAKINRDKGFFMWLDNIDNYGHLINSEDYDLTVAHPDLYQLFDNRFDWEQKYLHENFSKVLTDDYVLDQPCPDVYWFPIFSVKFCLELIDTMEKFGKWSDGSNSDSRLQGGYENVPTRDIHMNQIEFERHWLYILDEFVRPVQEKVFTGYYHKPAQAIMNFVVRYRPDEQPSLRPHHDSSTYTINVNLNRPRIDYEGGGARFIRYNCSVVDLRQGWGLIHPGRLTHYHEGLLTTKGTRYILVSFVNP